MKIDVSKIYEGWRNKLIPPSRLKQTIKRVSEDRLKICSVCEHHSENAKLNRGYKSARPDAHCTDCGCTLSAKTACLSCECPLKKWRAVLTNEQEEEIRQENGK